MKLKLISEFFYPYQTSTQKILTELAEDLVEQGLDVSVLTTKNAYREEKQTLRKYEVYKGIKIKRIAASSFSRDSFIGRILNYLTFTTGNAYREEKQTLRKYEVYKGIKIKRIAASSFSRDSFIGRILNYLTFTTGILFNLLFINDYDKILFVSNPPLVPFIGYLVNKLRRKPYVYLVHDVYPDVAIKLGVIKPQSLIAKIMNFMNNKIYQNAEKIIVLGEDMKKVIVKKGISPDKIVIITNWADSTKNYPVNVSDEFYKKYQLNNKFNVLYTGNISKIYQNAEKIIVLGEDMKKVIVKKGISPDKIVIITNWADSTKNYPVNVSDEFYKKYQLNNKFNVLYTGNISKVHAIDSVLELARRLKGHSDIQFMIVGDGNRKQYIEEVKRSENLDNILLAKYMFGEEYNNLLNCANIFITTLQDGIEGLGVPSKTYTYMSVHKPLLAVMSETSEIGKMVNQYQLGAQYNAGSEEEMAKFILNQKNNIDIYNGYCQNVKKTFNQFYERKKVTQKFYEELIG